MEYLATIGLEVHVRLRTATKLFCRCENRFGAPANSLVCEVCLGYPGALPVLNRRAVDQALRLAIALDCDVADRSQFVRKHYFYPDQPKGYQITQRDQPLARGGRLRLSEARRWVPIERVQLEEDAGRLLHPEASGAGDGTAIDFNRSGAPLAEVVFAPELATPEEARDLLRSLQRLVRLTETGDASLARGSLRCDANVSLRRPGQAHPGTRTEIKNLNSLRNLTRALEAEIERQRSLLEEGGHVDPQTRHFEEATGRTVASRCKEGEEDYRFLVEPDLPPLVLDPRRLARARDSLGPRPWQLEEHLETAHGLSADVARLLVADRELYEYFERAVEAAPALASAVADWCRTELLHLRSETGRRLVEIVSPVGLAGLVEAVGCGEITRRTAKELLSRLVGTGEDPLDAAARLGLDRPLAEAALDVLVDEVLAGHEAAVADYRAGREQAIEFLLGQVMGRSRGRARVAAVRRRLRRRLSMQPVESPAGGEDAS